MMFKHEQIKIIHISETNLYLKSLICCTCRKNKYTTLSRFQTSGWKLYLLPMKNIMILTVMVFYMFNEPDKLNKSSTYHENYWIHLI